MTEESRSESCSAISHHHRTQASSSSPTATEPGKSRSPPLNFNYLSTVHACMPIDNGQLGH